MSDHQIKSAVCILKIVSLHSPAWSQTLNPLVPCLKTGVASMHAHAQSTITNYGSEKPFATTFHFCPIKWNFYPFINFKHMRTSGFKKKGGVGGLKIRFLQQPAVTHSLNSFFSFFLWYFQLSEVVGMMNTFCWDFPLDCSHNQSTFKQECVPMCANGNTHINVHTG